MIDIDGSYKEGGGQILRTASLLSCATEKAFHIFNIRKGRAKPGLRYQHLLGLRALTELYNAELEGADLGSTEVWFTPKNIGTISRNNGISASLQHELPICRNKNTSFLQVKIPTAGSITLVLQSLIIPCSSLKKPVKIIFDGGATDTSFSPTINYYLYALIPLIRQMGYKIEIDIKRQGYYPKGGAILETTVYPNERLIGSGVTPLLQITNRGKLQKICILSYASKTLEKRQVAERQLKSAENVILKSLQPNRIKVGVEKEGFVPMYRNSSPKDIFAKVKKEIRYFSTVCPGSSIDIIAEYEDTWLGANALGEPGKRAEEVGEEAARILLDDMNSSACLDKYMADQILPYVALSLGESEFTVASITEHCLTNMWVIEKFIAGKFQIDGNIIRWLKR